jgi:uncharacterized protein (DUF58 family)
MRRARAVAGAGALLTLAAFVFDAAPLFVAGAGFLLLGALTPLWIWRAARGASVERRLAAEQVVEDEAVEAIIQVRRGRLGLPGAEVHDAIARHPVRISAPLALITGERSAEIRVVARFERRGLRRLEPPTLVVRDALGLATVARPGRGNAQELLVLPRTEPVQWAARDRGRALLGPDGGTVDEPLAAVDVDGLRPYRLGTPASRIHWPALARGHGLLERQLRADGEARPLVVLDARNGEDAAQLDAAVRAAASLTLELARRGGCRLLLPGARRPLAIEPDMRTWPAAHTRLALLTVADAAPVLSAGGGAAAIFYVALCDPRRPPAALTGARGRFRVLVVPEDRCPDDTGPASLTVAGCRGYRIGAGSGRRGARAA